MAVLYSTGFEEYTQGVAPDDWDLLSGPDRTWRVDLLYDLPILYAPSFDSNVRPFYAPPAAAFVEGEMVARVRATTNATVGPYIGLHGTTNTTGTYISLNMINNEVGLVRWVNGSATLVPTFAFPTTGNTWYWLKLRYETDRYFIRAWADGDEEPSTWLGEVVTTPPDAEGGRAFLGARSSGADYYFDDVEVRDFLADVYRFYGTISDKNGDLAQRRVIATLDSSGECIGNILSDPVTGEYELETVINEPHTLTFGGEADRNALVFTGVMPEEIP